MTQVCGPSIKMKVVLHRTQDVHLCVETFNEVYEAEKNERGSTSNGD